ncbi:MAG: hypothetical protein INQ03_03055 [Candidatus Heimdallarchaeota archaeon]|nr:hypothetical protein [Candidatus Heimdallarchaeota archaeon]
MKEVIDFDVSDENSLKIKEKLPSEEINLMHKYIREEDIDRFKLLINNWDLNYKSINQVKQGLSRITPSKAFVWANALFEEEVDAYRIVGGLLYIRAEIWNRDYDLAVHRIVELSECEEWKIRGVGINLLTSSLLKQYDDFKELYLQFIDSDSEKLRRVAISSAHQIAVYKGKVNFMDQDFLNHLTPFLTEENSYVNSVSNEAFGSFLKNYPDLFFNWIETKSSELNDSRSKASILYILSNINATNYVKESCDVIDKFIRDDDIKVKHARSAALRNLAKYHSKEISLWLEKRMNIPQAVEHWSELSVDGIIPMV